MKTRTNSRGIHQDDALHISNKYETLNMLADKSFLLKL